MRVTYTAPNRSSHYFYARELARHDCLHRFVCGFSRFSPRAALPEVGEKMVRADHLQNIYLAALKLRLPRAVTDELAYLSKIWIDRLSLRPAAASDIFLFYSGAGLRTVRSLKETPVLSVVEAVNSHVLVQERIMREEHARLGLPFTPFHPREVTRRVREYEEADAILCPSAFVRDSFAAEGLPAERLFVNPYGAAPPDPLGPTAREDGIFRVLYVGQISVRKGLRYLFEAFAQLRHPAKELWIIGPRAQETGLDGISLPDGARMMGVLKGEELARAYRQASVFVLPTLEEGLANVLGEALAFGLPVISTANSGASDLFTDGREGFILPIRDSARMAEKLQRLADDPAERERMEAAAWARARELGGWDSAGRLLVETLGRVAGLPKKR